MWFTSPRMIHGWFTEIPSWPGRVVSVSRNLVWRAVPVVGRRLRNRLVRRLWMGWGIGDSIGWRIRDVRRRPILLPQQHILLTEQLLPRRRRAGVARNVSARNERQPRRSWRSQRGARAGGARRNEQPFRATNRAFNEIPRQREDTLNRGQSAHAPGAFSGYGEAAGAKRFVPRSREHGRRNAWRGGGGSHGGGGGRH